MALLLIGLALAASMAAIRNTEKNRDDFCSDDTKLKYVGSYNGLEIYKALPTGLFYVSDGWAMKPVGSNKWKVNPVDMAFVKKKLQMFSHHRVHLAEFLLAFYDEREQSLLEELWKKYEKPRPPGKLYIKFIRSKSKKIKYNAKMEKHRHALATAQHKFDCELQVWIRDRIDYNVSSETAIIRTSMSRTVAPGNKIYHLTVPLNKYPGDTIEVNVGGKMMPVIIPSGCRPGGIMKLNVVQPFTTDIPIAKVVEGLNNQSALAKVYTPEIAQPLNRSYQDPQFFIGEPIRPIDYEITTESGDQYSTCTMPEELNSLLVQSTENGVHQSQRDNSNTEIPTATEVVRTPFDNF